MLSVIIPTYNEEKTLNFIVEDLKRVLTSLNEKHEIIVVNDGSEDNTPKIISRIKGIKGINNPYNLGYGASIKRGIKKSLGEWILIIDADGTYPGNKIGKMLAERKNYDMVVGARTGKNVRIPFFRRPAKFIISKLANFLVGRKIPDLNSGLRIFKREIAERFFHLFPDGFSFTTTITLACFTNEYFVKYVPINYLRRKGKSSISPIKDFIGFNMLIVRIITYFKPLKMFSLISFSILLLAVAAYIYSFFILGKLMDITVIVLLLASLQIFLFGMLADLIVRKKEQDLSK